MSIRALSLLLLAPIGLDGCARDLALGRDDALVVDDAGTSPDGAVLPPGGIHVRYAAHEDGYAVTLDATDAEAWVYLDLDEGAEIDPAEPTDDPEWDLAVRRSNLAVNGGASGTGGVSVAWVDGVAWAEVTVPASNAFTTDAPDSDDADALPQFALADWYDYDVATHVLTPKPRLVVIQTTEGARWKLRIERYYDDYGTSARYALIVAPIDVGG